MPTACDPWPGNMRTSFPTRAARASYSSHFVRQEPHVSPAPKPAMSSVSPFLRRPFSLASCRQIGIDAHEVLP